MDEDAKEDRLLQAVMTFIAFVSALPILGIVLGGAAFNGVNLVVILYIFFSTVGSVGLLVGTFTAFLKRPVFAWVAACSALSIALLSLIFLVGFLFVRTKGVSLHDPLYIGSVTFPILALYGFALFNSSAVTWLCLKRIRAQANYSSAM